MKQLKLKCYYLEIISDSTRCLASASWLRKKKDRALCHVMAEICGENAT